MSLELDFLFHPRSIAVAGASSDPKKQGHAYFRLLIENGFPGPLYPLNPRGEEVLGRRGYRSLDEIPGEVEYVISTVPASAAPALVEECGRNGVKVLHLFTGRFSETGHADAAALEREVLRRARDAGVRLIGPNGMGLHYPGEKITFKANLPMEAGSVAALAQSGGNAVEMVQGPSLRGVRFSKVLSYGNGLDLNEADFLEYLADDLETSVIGIYLEGAREGRRLFHALEHAAQAKPVIVWKGGRSAAGSRAVASHTASLAGNARVWDAMCRQAGAVPVSNMQEMVDAITAFSLLPPMRGVRVAIAGGGGGRSVQSADVCEEAGLVVAPLPESIVATLRTRDPDYWDWISNPVDGSILGGSPWRMNEIVALLAASSDYDAVIVNVDEQWSLDRPDAAKDLEHSMEGLLGIWADHKKPMAIVMGDSIQTHEWQTETMRRLRARCAEAGLLTFPTIVRAARTLRLVADYQARRSEDPEHSAG
ncbi:MAG: CoA-binding protein [Chloroflexi bacterium]|nr:CoA-binding protein [Chloroflexota bacterium]